MVHLLLSVQFAILTFLNWKNISYIIWLIDLKKRKKKKKHKLMNWCGRDNKAICVSAIIPEKLVSLLSLI